MKFEKKFSIKNIYYKKTFNKKNHIKIYLMALYYF